MPRSTLLSTCVVLANGGVLNGWMMEGFLIFRISVSLDRDADLT